MRTSDTLNPLLALDTLGALRTRQTLRTNVALGALERKQPGGLRTDKAIVNGYIVGGAAVSTFQRSQPRRFRTHKTRGKGYFISGVAVCTIGAGIALYALQTLFTGGARRTLDRTEIFKCCTGPAPEITVDQVTVTDSASATRKFTGIGELAEDLDTGAHVALVALDALDTLRPLRPDKRGKPGSLIANEATSDSQLVGGLTHQRLQPCRLRTNKAVGLRDLVG